MAKQRGYGIWRCAGRTLGLMALMAGLTGCASGTGGGAQGRFRYPFDAERAFRDLTKQVEFGPRVPGTPGHAACLAWLKGELARTADEVRTQSFQKTLAGKPVTMTNVLGIYGKGAKEWVVLCAHWDTRPTADEEIDPAKRRLPIPGANDGASGVAALLELGRTFKQTPPPFGVVMIFFDGEDYGPDVTNMFLGSTYFARDWQKTLHSLGGRVRHGILLDMVGYKNLRIPREAHSQRAAPKLMDEIYWHARSAGLEQYFPDEMGSAIMDDHIPLIDKGLPTVNLISFNYVYWHTLADTPDKCSPRSLAIVAEVVARTLYEDP